MAPMLGNGVATHIAFLGIGLNGFLTSFGIPALMLPPWFYRHRRWRAWPRFIWIGVYGGPKRRPVRSTPIRQGVGSARETAA